MILQKGLEVSYTRADNNSQQRGAEIYLMLLHWHIAISINAESSYMNKIKYIDVFITLMTDNSPVNSTIDI